MGREGRNDAVEIARQEKNRWKKRALRAEATLGKVWEAVSGHPFAECPEHPDDDAVTCGWKRAYADVLAALGESPTGREGAA